MEKYQTLSETGLPISTHIPLRHVLIFAGLFLMCSLASAGEISETGKTIIVSLDSDLISFLKVAVWVSGVFLALYALIGVVFFGWDVAKARNSLGEAQKEVKEQLKELRQDFREMKELKEKLEELGAKLQEDIEAPAGTQVKPPIQLPAVGARQRTEQELIREVIESSSYEWTTIGRISNKTALTHEKILSLARADPTIEIGQGRQTKDYIFKFKASKMPNDA